MQEHASVPRCIVFNARTYLSPKVQSVSRDFHENRSNCDKSVKFGTKLHNIIINQNRPGHK